jgi:hypothetical protein
MALTAHKTVSQFMEYVHTEDDQVRAAAEVVASRRVALLGRAPAAPPPPPQHQAASAPPPPNVEPFAVHGQMAQNFEDSSAGSRAGLRSYHPY